MVARNTDDAQQQTEETLRLLKLEISNFMRITALTVDAQGKHVVLSARNSSGKTSALEAIWVALQGASSKEIPEPIHRGAAKAEVSLDLGAIRVTRHWTEKSTKLVVTAADGSKIARPQELLDSLLGTTTLNPIAFVAKRPQEQVEDLLAVAGVEPPVAQVQQLTGDPQPALDGESADAFLERLAGENGAYYHRRAEANRAHKQKEAALAEARQALQQLGGPPDGQAASASDLLARIEELSGEGDRRRALEDAARKANRDLEDARRKLAGLSRDHADLLADINVLERQLADKRRQAELLAGRIQKGDSVVADLGMLARGQEQALAACPDRSTEIGCLRQRIAVVEREAARQRTRQAHAETVERLGKETATARQEAQRADAALEGLRKLRSGLLDGLDIGIAGLSVGGGELRLNGVSFKQASAAEKIKTALAVAMLQRPRLRLLRLDSAEQLDAESKQLVLRMASEAGFQCVMAQVADSKDLRVELIEGEAG